MTFNDKGRCYVVSFTALVFLFSFLLLTIIWDVVGFFSNLWPHHTSGERCEQASLENNKLECCWILFGFFFSPLFHYGKHQCCIHVSPVCFSNVCSNRRSTSSLAFVALAAFKNKCPVTFRRGRRSSNLFLPPTDERARPNGRAQILRKDPRNGKAPVQSVCLWWQSQVHYFTGRYSHMICV